MATNDGGKKKPGTPKTSGRRGIAQDSGEKVRRRINEGRVPGKGNVDTTNSTGPRTPEKKK